MKQQLVSLLQCYARQGKQLFYMNTDCSGRKLWTLSFSHNTWFPGIQHLSNRNLIVWLSRGKISLAGVLEGLQISSVTENPSVLPLQTTNIKWWSSSKAVSSNILFWPRRCLEREVSETEMRRLLSQLLHACYRNSHYMHCPSLLVQPQGWELIYFFSLDV